MKLLKFFKSLIAHEQVVNRVDFELYRGDSSDRVLIYLCRYDNVGGYNQQLTDSHTIKLFKKVERVVEKGEHQGYNEKNEPIVKEEIMKSDIELMIEVKILIESHKATKQEQIVKANALEDMESRRKQIETEIKNKFEQSRVELKETITEENVSSEFLMLEKGYVDVN